MPKAAKSRQEWEEWEAMAGNISRKIELEGPINFRDLGGIVTKDGRKIAPKRLIRSDLLSRLTPNDMEFLAKNYEVNLVYDLRRNAEHERTPDPIFPGARQVVSPVQDENNMPTPYPHENVPGEGPSFQGLQDFMYTYCTTGTALDNMRGMYRRFASDPFALHSYASFLDDLLHNEKGCTIYHCLDGKDRTGAATVYILMALGVKREDITEDYLASKENVVRKVRERHEHYSYLEKDHPDLLYEICQVGSVDARWLEKIYECIDAEGGELAFLEKKLDFGKEKIEAFRNLYLI